ncbi:MAG: hypothetical protein HC825_10875 [Oscillatoriales cyanobacterium RM1_1_9]|nr:hypothetical protein [Oscillatoriales cyanobacterium RM1_1_9]
MDFLGWLVLGCALATFLAFLAALHPNLKLWVIFIWAVFLTLQVFGWIADDAFANFLRIDVKTWWGILVLSLVCAIVGLGLWLFS